MKFHLGRRKFILGSLNLTGAVGAGYLLSKHADLADRWLHQAKAFLGPLESGPAQQYPIRLIAGHVDKPPEDPQQSVRVNGELLILDLTTKRKESIPVPFYAHGFAFASIGNEQIVATSQKWGDLGAVIDLSHSRILKEFYAPTDYIFSGHASFSPSKKWLCFSARARDPSGDGAILVYEMRNFSKIREIHLPRAIHEIRFINEQTILAAMNHSDNNEGRLQYVAVPSGELQEYMVVKDAGHVLPIEKRSFVVGGIFNKVGPLFLAFVDFDQKKSLDISSSPDFSQTHFHGEALGILKLSESNIAFTNPTSQAIGIWNIKSNRIAYLKMQAYPMGAVLLKENNFVISFFNNELLEFRYLPGSNKIVQLEKLSSDFANGAHVYTLPWNRAVSHS